MLMERPWGAGRVLLFASTANTAWNDLPVRPAFLPLLYRALGSVVGRQDERFNVPVGGRFVLPVEADALGQGSDGHAAATRDAGRGKEAGGIPRPT